MTSVNGLLEAPKPSNDSRIVGDEVGEGEELKLGKRVWLRAENVGVRGEAASDEGNDRDGYKAWPMDGESGDSALVLWLSLFRRASTN